MKTLSYARATTAALAGIIVGAATCAFADITTFRFDLVDKAMKVEMPPGSGDGSLSEKRFAAD